MVTPTPAELQICPPSHVDPILDKRYYSQDLDESYWATLCARVANAVAMGEETEELREYWAKIFYFELLHRRVLPNTPTWINAGLEGKRTLSGCFVLPLEDTMESILECSRLFGMVQKFGGGTGVALSNLRAKNVPISSTHGKACGPIMVLKYLGATSQMITQGGARQGANMAVLSVYHPDLIEFIEVKQKESEYLLWSAMEYAELKLKAGQWTYEKAKEYIEYCKQAAVYQLFNVSVAVDNDFMNAIEQYRSTSLTNPDLPRKDGISPWLEKLSCGRTISEVWEYLVEMATKSGDPGLVFIDRMNAFAELHSPYKILTTNPCGEQGLPDYGSCNLGSIDLSKFVYPRSLETKKHGGAQWNEFIQWDELQQTIHIAVRFLDNVVTVNKHADPEIARVNSEERRIGLGPMGWADMLLKLGIPYQSDEALEAAALVGRVFGATSHEASYALAEEKGAFPLWEQVKGKTLQGDHPNKEKILLFDPDKPRRNATTTCVAPTGTIRLAAWCSGGIEPMFRLGYEHMGMAEHGGIGFIWESETVYEMAKAHLGREPGIKDINQVTEYFRGKLQWLDTNEIPIESHIGHQAVWQRYIDNSISKTLNLAHTTTADQVEQAFLLSYTTGCKGSTIYRDRCKPFQVLNDVSDQAEEKVDSEASQAPPEYSYTSREKLPDNIPSMRMKIRTSHGNMYIHIGHLNGRPIEIFVTYGAMGSEARGFVDAIAKLASEMLRSGIHPARVVKNLRGIKTEPYGLGPNKVLSAADGIGKALEEYMCEAIGPDWGIDHGWAGTNPGEKPESAGGPAPPAPFLNSQGVPCPDCGSDLIASTGCMECKICGWTKCG